MISADTDISVNLFTQSGQDEFWSAVKPDIREALELFEHGETWTFHYDELPDLFTEMARALPSIVTLPLSDAHRAILRNLIPLLSTMPFRQCVFAIAWLDGHAEGDDNPGWGVASYAEAVNICNKESTETNPIYAHAKVVRDRVRILMRFKISADMFLTTKTH